VYVWVVEIRVVDGKGEGGHWVSVIDGWGCCMRWAGAVLLSYMKLNGITISTGTASQKRMILRM
jgi:hypothetical protein